MIGLTRGRLRAEGLPAMIQAKLDREDMSLSTAAAQVGTTSATLSRVVRRRVVPDLSTFAALVAWLGVSADAFIARDEPADPIATVEAHLRADLTMPPQTAKALADLVRSTQELATAVTDMAADLVEMDADTGIRLASWPSASRLVTLAGAWSDEDDQVVP